MAVRLEDYDPDPTHELDTDAVRPVREAVQERSEAERHIVQAIQREPETGMLWSVIGAFVGTAGEAARKRYGGKVT